jgi:hypothetical protein
MVSPLLLLAVALPPGCLPAAEVLAGIQSFDAVEGAQKGAEQMLNN